MFSCTLPVWSDDRKNARKQKEKERKKSLSKGKDRYTIVKGLAGGPDGISFESATKKKHFLRVQNNILIVEAYDDSEDYRKQSTFIPLQDMWFGGYVVFESLVEPAHFIRRCAEHLMLQKYENSPFFKEDASFKLARKRCIACVKIGSRVWARVEKGSFLRGVVVAVDDMVHIQLENGNKVKHKKMAPTDSSDCDYVPDIIPHPLEIDVGTRVLARWFNRLDSYYPATIIAVRRTYFNVKYDDGDKGSNNINEIRILKQPEVEGGTQIPSWSSLDGLPRVGGLCIDSSGEQSTSEEASDGHETGHDRWTPSRDIHERPESPSDTSHETDDKEAHFGYENNLQYLTPPNIQPIPHAPVVRNVSQVSGGSTDSGYHDSACAGSTRQRRTGLWAELHSKEKECSQFGFESHFLSPFSCNLHEPGLSGQKLSELSVTSSLDSGYQGGCSRHAEPRPYVRDNVSTYYPSPERPIPADKNPEKEAWGHEDTDALSDIETSNSTNYSTIHELDFPDSFTSGHTASFSVYNAEDNAVSHASYSEGHGWSSTAKLPYRTNNNANGPYVTENGACTNVTKYATANRTLSAKAGGKEEQPLVAKTFSSRTCPIHHHGAARERPRGNTGEKQHAQSGCDAVLSRESPLFIGLETVI